MCNKDSCCILTADAILSNLESWNQERKKLKNLKEKKLKHCSKIFYVINFELIEFLIWTSLDKYLTICKVCPVFVPEKISTVNELIAHKNERTFASKKTYLLPHNNTLAFTALNLQIKYHTFTVLLAFFVIWAQKKTWIQLLLLPEKIGKRNLLVTSFFLTKEFTESGTRFSWVDEELTELVIM